MSGLLNVKTMKKCQTCDGEEMITENPGEDNERDVVCPECYEKSGSEISGDELRDVDRENTMAAHERLNL